MKNTKRGFFGAIGALIFILLIAPAMAVSLDVSVTAVGTDLSRAKVTTDYEGVDNYTVTKYQQYLYAVDQEDFNYDMVTSVGDNHDVSVTTNLSGTHSPVSGISGNSFAENVGFGQHNETKSWSGFGIRADGADLVVASIVGITPTVLSQDFVIEANRGEAATGWVKRTDNVTTRGGTDYRAGRIVIGGSHRAERYPAGPADEESIKRKICPWGGDGNGGPIFTPRTSNGNVSGEEYQGYKTYRRG